ncbi:hypothetical protein HYX13_04215 [Candidatus Woesearchaeota archaeon]|nr:hypothetical protein [Candidatus Woesearchaeota archaeon]
MKVTIDTKEDSYDDLKKILHLIAEVLEKKGQSPASGYSSSSYPSSPYSSSQTATGTDTTPLMSMFDDQPTSGNSSMGASKNEAKDVAPDFSSFLNLTKPIERKETLPRIEIF